MIFQVHDEIEHLMEDDGDMAEMYLTEKKQRLETYPSVEPYGQNRINISNWDRVVSNSAPVSPVASAFSGAAGAHKLQRAFSSITASSKQDSVLSSWSNAENIEQLEMLLEAYFVVIDHTLSKLSSVKFSFFLLNFLYFYETGHKVFSKVYALQLTLLDMICNLGN